MSRLSRNLTTLCIHAKIKNVIDTVSKLILLVQNIPFIEELALSFADPTKSLFDWQEGPDTALVSSRAARQRHPLPLLRSFSLEIHDMPMAVVTRLLLSLALPDALGRLHIKSWHRDEVDSITTQLLNQDLIRPRTISSDIVSHLTVNPGCWGRMSISVDAYERIEDTDPASHFDLSWGTKEDIESSPELIGQVLQHFSTHYPMPRLTSLAIRAPEYWKGEEIISYSDWWDRPDNDPALAWLVGYANIIEEIYIVEYAGLSIDQPGTTWRFLRSLSLAQCTMSSICFANFISMVAQLLCRSNLRSLTLVHCTVKQNTFANGNRHCEMAQLFRSNIIKLADFEFSVSYFDFGVASESYIDPSKMSIKSLLPRELSSKLVELAAPPPFFKELVSVH